MSYKLKLGVALVVAALALPTLAAAQDPTTRLDVTVIGAVLNSGDEVADANAVATPQLPIVYEDDATASASDDNASDDEAAAASQAD